jgi:regulator of protease activity HflC (stomatin/prohibitin superfamily)
MLILRNGQPLKAGVGLKTIVWPGDTAITFSGKLREIKFKAEQVTQEMQGVEVTGLVIWSIFRDSDGPFKCYKSFGEDLQGSSNMANEKIMSLAQSIIRDKIANLSITDLLKNRNKLRSLVKTEMQKSLTGWGIWLETVEILDV